MTEAIFVSVIAGLFLAIILGLLNVQRHVQEWYVVSERAWKDYWRWSYDAGFERKQEFDRIGRVHAERGTRGSEEHLAEVERMLDHKAAEYKQQSTKMARDIDDATRNLRKVDRIFMVVTAKSGRRHRGRALKAILTKEPFSLDDVLDSVDEKWRKGELDELLKDQ